MKSTPHPDIDWNSLHRKVLAVALNLFRKQGLDARDNSVLKGLGASPSDLAQDSMKEFFAHRNRYDADTEDKCFAIIVTILRHDFLDLVTKKHAYTTTDDVQEEVLQEKIQNIQAVDNGFTEFETQVLAEEWHKYAAGDQELKDLIDATALVAVEQTAEPKSEDIAYALGISLEEVKKRKGRLLYRYHKLASKALNQHGG